MTMKGQRIASIDLAKGSRVQGCYGVAIAMGIHLAWHIPQLSPMVSFLGRYSIIVLLTHGVMVRAGYPLFQSLANTIPPCISVVVFWTCMACSYFAIVPFCKKFLPHVTAQRPMLYRQAHTEQAPDILKN